MMEINVKNFHPIGHDAGSYHGDMLIESVTMTQISVSELIGRYNLLLEYVAANAPAPQTQPAIDADGKLNANHEWHHEHGASWTRPARVTEDER